MILGEKSKMILRNDFSIGDPEIVLACPGQGSQKAGFLNEWLDLPGAQEFFEAQSEALKIDLVQCGTGSDIEILQKTNIAQPLIVATGIFILQTLCRIIAVKHSKSTRCETDAADANKTEATAFETHQLAHVGFAGHSVGEVTASFGAGILTPENAMRFVKHRARQMHFLTKNINTGMVALLGTPDNLRVSLEEYIEDRYGLFPANYNCPGQIVFAGLVDNIDKILADPPAKTKAVPLQVAGAFHTRFMRPARINLDNFQFLKSRSFANDPIATIWTNYNGSKISSGCEYVQLMINQVANPVRWDLCQKNFEGMKYLIELPPAGVLVGLARRAVRGVETVPINTVADLETAAKILSM